MMQDILDPILHVPLPSVQNHENRVNLQPLVQTAMTNPVNNTLVCQGQPRCSARLLECQLVPVQGEVQIIDLVRLGQHGLVRFQHLNTLLIPLFTDSCHYTSIGARLY